ncbi:MAG: BamA/TamA family outer membrane protein [Cyclobacteriaceae bacterium]
MSGKGLSLILLIVFTLLQSALGQGLDKDLSASADSIGIDSSRVVTINEIYVVGNKKTKAPYILREMSVEEGEEITYGQLRQQLDRDAQKIFNLRIFEESHTNIIERDGDLVDVEIKVRERWYLWPFPIFRLADRNFNAWWNTRERDFSRLIYGVSLDHKNIRGRGEWLRLTAQFGFTRNWQLFYQKPYIDKEKKFGFATLFGFTEFKNVAYETSNNVLNFLSTDEGLLRESYQGAFAFNYRPNFFTRHGVTLGYIQNNIADTVATLNPGYLLEGRKQQKAIWMAYTVIKDNRDLVYYPLKGSFFSFQFQRMGLGAFDDVGIWSTEVRYTKYFDLGNQFYFATHGQINASVPFDQPFINYQRMGFFENFVRGYELSVVEGPVWMLNRNSFRKKIFGKEFKIRNFTKLDQFAKFPLQLYLTTFLDTGWAEAYPGVDQSRFNNTLLMGTGIGLDIVTFYDVVLRLEYSYSLENDFNFFFNVRAAI